MAEATSTLTVNPYPYGVDNTQVRTLIYGECALSSGGDYATNGIPLNWQTLLDGNFPDAASGQYFTPKWGATQTQPQQAEFFSETGENATPAYQTYAFDQTHNTLRIFVAGVELGNGDAIPADTIFFKAEFIRGI